MFDGLKRSIVNVVNSEIAQNAASNVLSWATNGATHILSRNGISSNMSSHGGKRQLNDIYGYPDAIGFQQLYSMATRDSGIANRLTFGTARRCWRQGFEVFDDENPVLEDQIKELANRGLFDKLERADVLNRIGRFSALYVGVPDGLDPSMPVGRVTGDGFKSIYFRPFAYDGIEINQWVTDPANPRFGLPEMYTLQKQSRDSQGKDVAANSIRVHWSRVIHLSEMSLDSDVEGIAYLEPIFNALLDLIKTRGGSSEAYFRNAKGKIAYEVDKDFARSLLDPDSKKKLDEGARSYTNEYQDHTFAAGSTVKAINTPHYSPKDTWLASLWEISGYSGYPVRVLTGEGSGQLAGSEDQLSVNAIIQDRQNLFCSGVVVRLFEILNLAGMVEWNPSWEVRFPKQDSLTEQQEIEMNNTKADTIAKISQARGSGGGDELDLEAVLSGLGIEGVIDSVD